MLEFITDFVPHYLPQLLKGALVTIELSIISMLCSITVGVVCAVGMLSGFRVFTIPIRIYVEICRGVPLIVILLAVYFLLPHIGISLPAFGAAVVGLTFNLGAYLSEVFRAAILAVDPGQRQAGLALGMNRLVVFWKVILPQAAIIAVPTVGGYFISLLKDCSLVFFVTVEELMQQGRYVISATFRTEETYLLVGMIYFTMSFFSARVIKALEVQLRPKYLRV
ncbi:MAG: amino acid ABC transporter permease [Verrucomicrobiaceae bacterium]|uniref:amino acid ABC transporter permease n=1 Tax=Aestuariivirga sp. TaxID=2650926 RepID=UPI0030158F00